MFTRIVKRIIAWIVFVFTFGGKIKREAEESNICKFNGQEDYEQ